MDSDDDMYSCADDDAGNSSSSEGEAFAMDDDDDVAIATDSQEPKPSDDSNSDYPFEILSTEQIVDYMQDFIKEVNTVVEIPATTTRILLNHFKWDKLKLMEKYYDGDREQLFAEARVVDPAKFSNETDARQSSNETEDCEVCFLPTTTSTMSGLPCGHRFCPDCWNDYLTTKIMDEGMGQTIACAAHKCDILVDDASVTRLVKDPRVKLKYQLLITNSFVDCHKLVRWCSSPGCDRAIRVHSVEAKPVTCLCNSTFCFACGEDWHDPITCQLLRQWLKQCEKDSENAKWITSHTKECPECYASIEKNGGCNYIRCQKCNYQFCWICMNDWKIHPSNWYRCNKYDPSKSTEPHDPSKSLQRYLFYHFRYMTHKDSLKLEYKLYDAVGKKMEEMQQQDMTWIEVQFMRKAVDVLRSCRLTLMYTYAFAYYLKKTNQTAIFEDNQRDLELSVETLSGYLEQDMEAESLSVIKQTVVNKSMYCESRRKALVRHVHDGYEQDWWEYVD